MNKGLHMSIFACVCVMTFTMSSMLMVPCARAGELEPPPDAVDAGGNPVGTMKSLVYVQPSWSRAIAGEKRFLLVMEGGAAVLDRETGLVWEKSLHVTSNNNQSWKNSWDICNLKSTGGRHGWRMPTITELLTLYDPSQPDNLPSGHPFVDLPATNFTWSATTPVYNQDLANTINFTVGTQPDITKGADGHVWCVRGGGGIQPWVSAQPPPPSS